MDVLFGITNATTRENHIEKAIRDIEPGATEIRSEGAGSDKGEKEEV
jgi:hypothetical protein